MLRKLNFKVIFCLFILVFPLMLSGIEIWAEEKIKIAAWNIERFGHRDDDTQESKRDNNDLKAIVEIISGYDLVVVTEFMDEEIKLSKNGKFKELRDGSKASDFEKTLPLLSEFGYDHRVSPIAGYGYQGQESYAFLFKAGEFEVVEPPQLYKKGDFTRKPCWMTFRRGDFDFTVIAVHILFGAKDGEKFEERRDEVRALKKVYDDIQDMDPKENDILLVGDFNLDPEDDAFDELKSINTMRALFYKKNGCKSTSADAKPLYDNILFETQYLKNEYANNCGIYLFDLEDPIDLKCCEGKAEKVPDGNKRKSKGISNHYPVWAEFRIDLEDDD